MSELKDLARLSKVKLEVDQVIDLSWCLTKDSPGWIKELSQYQEGLDKEKEAKAKKERQAKKYIDDYYKDLREKQKRLYDKLEEDTGYTGF